MSLRKRKFIGGLSKRDLTRSLIIGGMLAGILLTAWIVYPYVIDAFFGGSRKGYNTQADLPVTKQYYNLTAIPFNVPFSIDPTKLNPNMIDLLKTLFDPSNMQLPSNFMALAPLTYNIVLFSYQDLSYSPYNNGIMRQDAYDTISTDGSTWSKSINTESLFSSQNYDHGTFSSSCRKIIFNITSTTNINMKLPFFPYTPTYIQNSLMFQQASGSTTLISDTSTLYKNQDDGASIAATGLPSFSGANLTYCIREDPTISSVVQDQYKSGLIYTLPPYSDTPPTYTNYIQMPGVDPTTRDLTSYLSSHPRFNSVYTYLQNQGYSKYLSSTSDILNAISTYLYNNYDLYTAIPLTGPERPATGQDMVEWFLGRTKATNPNAGGTPYDFAAAFVMLARAFDIPARLATGFYDWDHDNKIEVMNAYAWAEAYLPTQNYPSYDGKWIVYDFPDTPNVSQLSNFLPPPQQFIHVNVPAQGSTFNQLNNIPLNITMYTNGTISNVDYSLDGAPGIAVSYAPTGIPGYYQAISTFNVPATGYHTIQANMTLNNGTVITSLTNGFTVSQEQGTFLRLDSPPNYSSQTSNNFVLDYTATNSSPVVSASYSIIYTNNGTLYASNVPITPALPHAVVPFTVTAYGNFRIIASITTQWGSFNSATSPATSILGYFTHASPNPMPDASFVPSTPLTITQHQSVTFTHTGSNGVLPATWSWNFGDGTSATVENPVHQFNTLGTFDVSLTVTDANGSTSTVTHAGLVHVIPDNYPDASFTANQTNIQANQSVAFTHTGTNGYTPATWSWNFGDGGTAIQQNPVHLYTTPGIYNVSLTVTDFYGEANTVQRIFYIHVNTTAPSGTPTTITVDFTPKSVELFQDINITGFLRFLNATGIGSQNINIRIEYYLGAQLNGVETASAITDGTGFYQVLNHEVTIQSDLIRVIATFPGTTSFLSSSASVEG